VRQGNDWGGWIRIEAEWGVAPRLSFNEQEGKESSGRPEYAYIDGISEHSRRCHRWLLLARFLMVQYSRAVPRQWGDIAELDRIV
jgi:hypothetical protein